MALVASMLFKIIEDVHLAWFPGLEATTRAPQVEMAVDGSKLSAPYVVFPASRIEAPRSGLAVLFRIPPMGAVFTLTDEDGAAQKVDLRIVSGLDELIPRLLPDARIGLLRQMLDGVPTYMRRNGPALARACGTILDAMQTEFQAVGPAFTLGGDLTLAWSGIRGRDLGVGGYRLTQNAVQRETGAINITQNGQHWLFSGHGPNALRGGRIIGFGDRRVWQISLDDVKPAPAAKLLQHIERMKSADASRLLNALDVAISAKTSSDAKTLIEDCRVFFGQGSRGFDGQPVKLFGFGIDATIPVPGGGVLVKGWLFDPMARIRHVEAVDATGSRFILPKLWPIQHEKASKRWRDAGLPAPERAGFMAFVEGGIDGVWSVDFVTRSGARVAAIVPDHETDPRRARDALLAGLPASAEIDGAVKSALAPAVERLHSAHMARFPSAARVAAQIHIGPVVAKPRVSVIVPLYRNLNFLGFQLAAFAQDPDFADIEIIYVLDSPEQVEFLEGRLRGEHLIYGTSIVMVVHTENFGFASAVNTGARVARGRDFVFLNSDVVPDEPGWVDRLIGALQQPDVGATGAKLLYLDDSLQFAGLYFERSSDSHWYNRHIAKGFPRDYPVANVARKVPGLTGACLAVKAEIFERIGGFDEDFVIGDFEDSDFSLRLHEIGLSCWYEPSAVLYHVERQSIERHEAHGKSAATMVNRWRQHRIWGDVISAVMDDSEKRWGLPPNMSPQIERQE